MNHDQRLARAAGILEGEGSFLTKSKHSPWVKCQMTDKDVLLDLQDFFGGSLWEVTPQKSHHKPSWVWSITGQPAYEIMASLRPFLFERRQAQVDRAMAIWEIEQKKVTHRSAAIEAGVAAYLRGEGSYREISERYGATRSSIYYRIQSARRANV